MRRAQTSRYSFIAVCEGASDLPYFENLLDANSAAQRAGVLLFRSAEIKTGAAPGKSAVLELYRFARKKGILCGDFKRHKFVFAFLLDRDCDQLLGRLARSEHCIYTSGYSFENALVDSVDEVSMIAAMAMTTKANARSHLRQYGNDGWRGDALKRWKGFVVFCLACQFSGVAPSQNFGRAYPPTKPHNLADIDRMQLAKLWQSWRRACVFEKKEPHRFWRRAHRCWEIADAKGVRSQTIPGKWLIRRICAESLSLAGQPPICSRPHAESCVVAIVLSLDYSALWATSFHKQVESLARHTK